MNTRQDRFTDQRGVAAIMITMVMMIVITLMVLGFAAISRREQRGALDAQLQTQAFYAAESGVNDAKSFIAAQLASGVSPATLNKSGCDNAGTPYNGHLNPVLDAAANIAYSCVLVDMSPEVLINTSVTDTQSWMTPLTTTVAPAKYTLTWQPKAVAGDPVADCNTGAVNTFTASTVNMCGYGVLRVDLVDVATISGSLDTVLATYYFQPRQGSGGNSVGFAVSPTGSVTPTTFAVRCPSSTYDSCSVDINGPGLGASMAMRITSLYRASSVRITASDATGSALSFTGGQIVIDATGKAQDILRRIQVRVPVNSSEYTPNYAVQTTSSICKRYITRNNYFVIGDGIDADVSPSDPMCQAGAGGGGPGPGPGPGPLPIAMESIDVGNYHVCANSSIASGGLGYCWGKNDFGQLGNGTNNNTNAPFAVTTTGVLSGKVIVSTAAGYNHTCVVDTLGRVYCWGYNSQGQLGNGATAIYNNPWPTAVVTTGPISGKQIVKVNAGDAHTCALASDGTAYCWGSNIYGQLGNGGTSDSSVPTAVSMTGALAGKSIIDISAGYQHTCVVTSDSNAYCWGFNSHGQLGNGTTTDSSVPAQVSGGLQFVRVSAGHHHTCGITVSGRAYCWGNGQQGRLGNGGMANTSVPVAVSISGGLGGKTVTDVTAGFQHSCAVANGTLYCWGLNSYGQLGNGAVGVDQLSPVAVTTSGALSGKTMADVAAGQYSTCAVAATGEVYCWGVNDNGQLGNSSTVPYSTVPVSVPF